MTLPRLSIVCPILIAIGASSAFAADDFTPAPVKASAHVTKAKTKAKSATVTAPAGGSRDNALSYPSAPFNGATKSTKTALPADAKGAFAEPASGLSLGLKWHANNDPVDHFNAVRHTWGPDGPGEGVEAGVKIGF